MNSFEDRSGTTGDTMNYLTDLGLQFQPDESLTIGPYAQLSIFRDNATTDDLDSVNLGLDIAADLIPEVFTATPERFFEPDGQCGTTHRIATSLAARCCGTLYRPRSTALAWRWRITGSYQHTRRLRISSSPTISLQVFGKLKLTLPLAY